MRNFLHSQYVNIRTDTQKVAIVRKMPENIDDIPFIAEVIQGGRITIPDNVRDLFDIKEGFFVLCRLKVISRRDKKRKPKERAR